MSSKLFTNIYTQFNNIASVADYKSFFSNHDKWVIIIPLIRLRDRKGWLKFWSFTYNTFLFDGEKGFKNMLLSKKIKSKKEFLLFLDNMFLDIISGKGLEFNTGNDLSVIFSNKKIKDLLCHCKTITIHSAKKEKLFSQETCIDVVYFLHSTIENKLYEKILFNQMMKDICISFLNYIKENDELYK